VSDRIRSKCEEASSRTDRSKRPGSALVLGRGSALGSRRSTAAAGSAAGGAGDGTGGADTGAADADRRAGAGRAPGRLVGVHGWACDGGGCHSSAVHAVLAVVCLAELRVGEGDVGTLRQSQILSRMRQHGGGVRRSYVVESSAWVSVGDDLNGGIHAFGDVKTSGVSDGSGTQAEILRAHFLESRDKGDVVVVTRVVAKRHQNLDLGGRMTLSRNK